MMPARDSLRFTLTLADLERHAEEQKKLQQLRESKEGYFGPQALQYPNSAKPIEKGAMYDVGRALERFDVPIASGVGRYLRGMATGEQMGPAEYIGASLDLPVPIAGAVKPVRKAASRIAKKGLPEWMKTKPLSVVRATNRAGGHTVHAKTGKSPAEGYMVGMFPEKSEVVDAPLKASQVESFLSRHKGVLKTDKNFLGTWKDMDTGKVHLDIARRYEGVRPAFYAADEKEQLAIFDIGALEELRSPERWRDWVRGEDFSRRLEEMLDLGERHIKATGHEDDWWNIFGKDNPWERIYGTDTRKQQAGFLAATAPNSHLKQNVQAATEYLRRAIKGESIVQPEYRSPIRGNQMPMETNRVANLGKVMAGDLGSMRGRKVMNEAAAIMGDPNATVFDTHWSKLAEKPRQNIYVGPEANKIPDPRYEVLEDVVKPFARAKGYTPNEFAAKVWTGIREQLRTGELYGETYKKTRGSSLGYAHILKGLITREAKERGVTPAEIEKMLSKGDISLFPAIITPLLTADLGGALTDDQSTAP